MTAQPDAIESYTTYAHRLYTKSTKTKLVYINKWFKPKVLESQAKQQRNIKKTPPNTLTCNLPDMDGDSVLWGCWTKSSTTVLTENTCKRVFAAISSNAISN